MSTHTRSMYWCRNACLITATMKRSSAWPTPLSFLRGATGIIVLVKSIVMLRFVLLLCWCFVLLLPTMSKKKNNENYVIIFSMFFFSSASLLIIVTRSSTSYYYIFLVSIIIIIFFICAKNLVYLQLSWWRWRGACTFPAPNLSIGHYAPNVARKNCKRETLSVLRCLASSKPLYACSYYVSLLLYRSQPRVLQYRTLNT